MATRFIDYALKQKVLNEHADLVLWQRRASLYDYAMNNYINEGVIRYALKTNKEMYTPSWDLINYCIANGLLKEYKECIRINNASYKRTERLKERVSAMLERGTCLFLTLTFTDDTLSKTTEKQRRVAVSRYLKQYNSLYIANIDFGAKNHREHYHALIQCERVNHQSWRKYGSIDFERVRYWEDDSAIKLSHYVSKLSNHAIKETACRGALIYSR